MKWLEDPESNLWELKWKKGEKKYIIVKNGHLT
jgi:hypothetical protein